MARNVQEWTATRKATNETPQKNRSTHVMISNAGELRRATLRATTKPQFREKHAHP
jgi:hypothetical protein